MILDNRVQVIKVQALRQTTVPHFGSATANLFFRRKFRIRKFSTKKHLYFLNETVSILDHLSRKLYRIHLITYILKSSDTYACILLSVFFSRKKCYLMKICLMGAARKTLLYLFTQNFLLKRYFGFVRIK